VLGYQQVAELSKGTNAYAWRDTSLKTSKKARVESKAR
jgi:hypothetical protein